LTLGDPAVVRLGWRGLPFLLGRHCDDAVGSDLRHSTPRRFRFEIGDELAEIDIIADVKADVHRARGGRAHAVERLREGGTRCPAGCSASR
jgi:hypothetical protein